MFSTKRIPQTLSLMNRMYEFENVQEYKINLVYFAPTKSNILCTQLKSIFCVQRILGWETWKLQHMNSFYSHSPIVQVTFFHFHMLLNCPLISISIIIFQTISNFPGVFLLNFHMFLNCPLISFPTSSFKLSQSLFLKLFRF